MPDPSPLAATMLGALADLVGKPILAHLVAADGAVAVVHADLACVDTADDTANLRFSELARRRAAPPRNDDRQRTMRQQRPVATGSPARARRRTPDDRRLAAA